MFKLFGAISVATMLVAAPAAQAVQTCNDPVPTYAAPGYAPNWYGPQGGHFGQRWMPWFGPRYNAPAPYGYGPRPQAPVAAPVAPAQSDCPPKIEEPAAADGDKDGVLDLADLCPNTAIGVAVDVFGCAEKAAIVLDGVNFELDSDKLTSESFTILNRVAATLVANPGLNLEVSGHTDSQGDDNYNLDLSQRRSERVRGYLIEKGVKADSLTAKGYGEAKPMAENASKEGRALNRRVELNRT